MVKKFEVGKYYQYTGRSIQDRDDNQHMAAVLDNKPRKCINSKSPCHADFEGIPPRFDGWGWSWGQNMNNWEEYVSVEMVFPIQGTIDVHTQLKPKRRKLNLVIGD